MTKHHQLLILISMIGFAFGCNAPKKAYHYYRMTELVPYVAAITMTNGTGDESELTRQESLEAGSNSELWLVAQVEYYYKEKRKDSNPAQRGSKGSEEKITAFDLYLDSGESRIPLTDRIKKATLKTAEKVKNMPTGIAVPMTNREDRTFEGLEEFASQFNAAADPFLYDHNLARAYLFSLDTKGIPPGKYSLVVEVRFDSGKVLRNASPLTIR